MEKHKSQYNRSSQASLSQFQDQFQIMSKNIQINNEIINKIQFSKVRRKSIMHNSLKQLENIRKQSTDVQDQRDMLDLSKLFQNIKLLKEQLFKSELKPKIYEEVSELDIVIKALKKPYSHRKIYENEAITSHMYKFEFFKNLRKLKGREVVEQCFKQLSILEFKQGQFIFKQNDKGNYFYLILKGNVILVDDDKNKYDEKQNQFVKSLGKGQSFGELALFQTESTFIGKRTLSCKTIQPTILACLYRKNYKSIIELYQAQFLKTLKFLLNLQIFNSLSYAKIKNIEMVANQHQYQRNQIIYKQNSTPLFFFIIIQGDVAFQQISKDPEYKKENLYYLSSEEVFGYSEIIDQKQYENQAICYSQICILYQISVSDFVTKIFNESSKLRKKFKQMQNLHLKFIHQSDQIQEQYTFKQNFQEQTLTEKLDYLIHNKCQHFQNINLPLKSVQPDGIQIYKKNITQYNKIIVQNIKINKKEVIHIKIQSYNGERIFKELLTQRYDKQMQQLESNKQTKNENPTQFKKNRVLSLIN